MSVQPKGETGAIEESGDPHSRSTLSSTMAKTDSEVNVSEHTSENEDVDQAQSDGGGSKMTLKERQQKFAHLQSRMVRSDTVTMTFHQAHEQSTAFICSSQQKIFDGRKHEGQGISKRCSAVGASAKAC